MTRLYGVEFIFRDVFAYSQATFNADVASGESLPTNLSSTINKVGTSSVNWQILELDHSHVATPAVVSDELDPEPSSESISTLMSFDLSHFNFVDYRSYSFDKTTNTVTSRNVTSEVLSQNEFKSSPNVVVKDQKESEQHLISKPETRGVRLSEYGPNGIRRASTTQVTPDLAQFINSPAIDITGPSTVPKRTADDSGIELSTRPEVTSEERKVKSEVGSLRSENNFSSSSSKLHISSSAAGAVGPSATVADVMKPKITVAQKETKNETPSTNMTAGTTTTSGDSASGYPTLFTPEAISLNVRSIMVSGQEDAVIAFTALAEVWKKSTLNFVNSVSSFQHGQDRQWVFAMNELLKHKQREAEFKLDTPDLTSDSSRDSRLRRSVLSDRSVGNPGLNFEDEKKIEMLDTEELISMRREVYQLIKDARIAFKSYSDVDLLQKCMLYLKKHDYTETIKSDVAAMDTISSGLSQVGSDEIGRASTTNLLADGLQKNLLVSEWAQMKRYHDSINDSANISQDVILKINELGIRFATFDSAKSIHTVSLYPIVLRIHIPLPTVAGSSAGSVSTIANSARTRSSSVLSTTSSTSSPSVTPLIAGSSFGSSRDLLRSKKTVVTVSMEQFYLDATPSVWRIVAVAVGSSAAICTLPNALLAQIATGSPTFHSSHDDMLPQQPSSPSRNRSVSQVSSPSESSGWFNVNSSSSHGGGGLVHHPGDRLFMYFNLHRTSLRVKTDGEPIVLGIDLERSKFTYVDQRTKTVTVTVSLPVAHVHADELESRLNSFLFHLRFMAPQKSMSLSCLIDKSETNIPLHKLDQLRLQMWLEKFMLLPYHELCQLGIFKSSKNNRSTTNYTSTPTTSGYQQPSRYPDAEPKTTASSPSQHGDREHSKGLPARKRLLAAVSSLTAALRENKNDRSNKNVRFMLPAFDNNSSFSSSYHLRTDSTGESALSRMSINVTLRLQDLSVRCSPLPSVLLQYELHSIWFTSTIRHPLSRCSFQIGPHDVTFQTNAVQPEPTVRSTPQGTTNKKSAAGKVPRVTINQTPVHLGSGSRSDSARDGLNGLNFHRSLGAGYQGGSQIGSQNGLQSVPLERKTSLHTSLPPDMKLNPRMNQDGSAQNNSSQPDGSSTNSSSNSTTLTQSLPCVRVELQLLAKKLEGSVHLDPVSLRITAEMIQQLMGVSTRLLDEVQHTASVIADWAKRRYQKVSSSSSNIGTPSPRTFREVVTEAARQVDPTGQRFATVIGRGGSNIHNKQQLIDGSGSGSVPIPPNSPSVSSMNSSSDFVTAFDLRFISYGAKLTFASPLVSVTAQTGDSTLSISAKPKPLPVVPSYTSPLPSRTVKPSGQAGAGSTIGSIEWHVAFRGIQFIVSQTDSTRTKQSSMNTVLPLHTNPAVSLKGVVREPAVHPWISKNTENQRKTREFDWSTDAIGNGNSNSNSNAVSGSNNEAKEYMKLKTNISLGMKENLLSIVIEDSKGQTIPTVVKAVTYLFNHYKKAIKRQQKLYAIALRERLQAVVNHLPNKATVEDSVRSSIHTMLHRTIHARIVRTNLTVPLLAVQAVQTPSHTDTPRLDPAFDLGVGGDSTYGSSNRFPLDSRYLRVSLQEVYVTMREGSIGNIMSEIVLRAKLSGLDCSWQIPTSSLSFQHYANTVTTMPPIGTKTTSPPTVKRESERLLPLIQFPSLSVSLISLHKSNLPTAYHTRIDASGLRMFFELHDIQYIEWLHTSWSSSLYSPTTSGSIPLKARRSSDSMLSLKSRSAMTVQVVATMAESTIAVGRDERSADSLTLPPLRVDVKYIQNSGIAMDPSDEDVLALAVGVGPVHLAIPLSFVTSALYISHYLNLKSTNQSSTTAATATSAASGTAFGASATVTNQLNQRLSLPHRRRPSYSSDWSSISDGLYPCRKIISLNVSSVLISIPSAVQSVNSPSRSSTAANTNRSSNSFSFPYLFLHTAAPFSLCFSSSQLALNSETEVENVQLATFTVHLPHMKIQVQSHGVFDERRSDACVWAELNSLCGHVGHAFGLRADQAPLVTGLFHISSCKGNINFWDIDKLFLFQTSWEVENERILTSIAHHTEGNLADEVEFNRTSDISVQSISSPSSSASSSMDVSPQSRPGSRLNRQQQQQYQYSSPNSAAGTAGAAVVTSPRWSILSRFLLDTAEWSFDLSQVSNVATEFTFRAEKFCVALLDPGSSEETWSINIASGPISLHSTGHLEGHLRTTQLYFLANWQPLQADIMLDVVRKGLNQWSLQLGAISMHLMYKWNEILELAGDAFGIKVTDLLERPDSADDPSSIPDMMMFMIEVLLHIGDINLKCSSATIPSIFQLQRGVQNYIEQQRRIVQVSSGANLYESRGDVGMDSQSRFGDFFGSHQPSSGLGSTRTGPRLPIPMESNRPLAVASKPFHNDSSVDSSRKAAGVVAIFAGRLHVNLYAEHFSDRQWLSISLLQMLLSLRQLNVQGKVARILNMSQARTMIGKSLVPHKHRWIFQLPSSMLEMITLQREHELDVRYDFYCKFDAPIVVGTNISHYQYLRDMVSLYDKEVHSSLSQETDSTNRVYSSTLFQDEPDDDSSGRASDRGRNTARQLNQGEPRSASAQADPRRFIGGDFVLEPQLNVFGDFTPSIEWVLKRIGIEREVIPMYTHSTFTDSLENILEAATKFSSQTDQHF